MDELLIARDRLKSEAAQAKIVLEAAVPPTAVPAGLTNVIAELDSVPDKMDDKQILIVQRCDAELCLYRPSKLLYPTYTRLEPNLGLFDEDRCRRWQTDLTRMLPNAHTIRDEDVLRQRLRQLTFELAEAEAEATRQTLQRSKARVQAVSAQVILIALWLIIGLLLLVNPFDKEGTFLYWLPPTCVAGALGATVSSMTQRGKQAEEDLALLRWMMVSRAMLGFSYALVVYSFVYAKIVPLVSIPGGVQEARAVYLGLGFVAGFSDKLFGQMVGRFVARARS